MTKVLNFYDIFKLNADETVEPIKVVRIGGVQMGPGVRFGKGVFLGEINLFDFVGKKFQVEEQDGVIIITGIYQ